jgi:glucose 1-dehydrogenase
MPDQNGASSISPAVGTSPATRDFEVLPGDLAGRLAVVTGAAHGIGRAIAVRLGRAGARVLAVDNDPGGLRAAFGGPARDGLDCTPVHGDLAGPDTAALAERLLAAHGPVHLIVNNVGMCTQTGFFETDEDRFDLVFHTNLRGPWFFTRRLVGELVDRGEGGAVLFISSLHDTFVVGRPQYSASKAGVAMLTRELARQLGPHRIRVNAISPGWVKTAPASPGLDETERARRMVPVGRPGQPDDIARIAVVLLSEACASYITGANVPVDGGLSLYNWVPSG